MAADDDIQAAERLMRLAEQATGPPGYGVSPAFLEQYRADLAVARADERGKITCKTCGKQDVPDWGGGECISCVRDRELGADKLAEALDKALDENFESHDDDDHSVCDSNFLVCQFCSKQRYHLNFLEKCTHTAVSVWKPKPCTCSYATRKATVKAALLATLQEQIERVLSQYRICYVCKTNRDRLAKYGMYASGLTKWICPTCNHTRWLKRKAKRQKGQQ